MKNWMIFVCLIYPTVIRGSYFSPKRRQKKRIWRDTAKHKELPIVMVTSP